MYQKRKKIIASMLIFMLIITHINTIGAVFATVTSIGYEEYLDFNFGVEENYLSIGVNTSLEYITVTIRNKYYSKSVWQGNKGETIQIPIELIMSEMTENKEIIDLNTLMESMNIYIEVTGHNIDEKGNIVSSKGVTKNCNLVWALENNRANLFMQLSKFIPYNINETKGVLLETIVQSYLGDNVLPIKDTKIEINVPTINNIKPKEIKVVANTTKATNGDEIGENFNKNNYTYDETSNKLTINVKNEQNNEGQIAWYKDAKDEFLVTYIYPEEALVEGAVDVQINGINYLTPYLCNTIISDSYSEALSLNEQVSNLVEFNIEIEDEEISKGQIYANYDTTNKIETEYQQTVTANIGLASVTDKIILEQNVDNFITKDNTKLQAKETYNKTIIIDKNEVNKILGENAEIYIYSGTTEIGKINKETTANSEDKYVIDVSKTSVNTLRIETSKPQTEGKLNFTIVKAIRGNSGYTKEQMLDINKLELNITGKAVNGTTNFVEQTKTKEITFTQPITQAELEINNANLSTVVVNENIKITAKLKTDSLDCNLYKNPTLKITLPNSIENINIKNIEVLFETEGSKLTLKSHEIVENIDGTKTIVINLEGTQTEYTLGAVSKGVNVVITSNITVNKFTPNKQEQIKMLYTNKNVITNTKTIEDINEVAVSTNIVAPVGVITTTTLSNYKEGAESVTSISGEEKTATLPILSKEMNANLSMEVINNYNNTIDNITILGRTMFKANKDILTGNDLGTTINMPLTSNITVPNMDVNKVKVYYSENREATKDINLASNAWTLTPANLENVKSYLIVLTDYSINTGEKIDFNYIMKIPENLQHNESAYENYVVYFNNNLETGTIEDKQASTKIGVTTGRGAVIEATMSSNIPETQEVLSGNIIKYTLTIKNTGTETAENVITTIQMPEYFTYVEEDKNSSLGYKYVSLVDEKVQIELGNIEINQTVEKQIWVKTFNTSQDLINTEIKATIASEDINELETNIAKNVIKKAYYRTSAIASSSNQEVIKEDATYKVLYTIQSTESTVNRTNTVVTVILPNELEYKNMKLIKEGNDITSQANVKWDKFSRKLTINIGEVDGFYGKEIEIETIVGKLEDNVYEKEINIQANVKGDNVETETINTINESINKAGLKVIQTSSIPNGTKITAGEDYTYIIEVQNLSNIIMDNIILTDYLPKELIYQNSKITYSTGYTTTSTAIDEDNNPIIKLNIESKQTAKVEINVIADMVNADTNISNKAKIEHEDIKTIESNAISHTIEKFEKPNSEVIQTTKRIMGQVWKDENNNGIKEDSEPKVNNIEVMLFNNQTGNLVTDANGNVLRQMTEEDGTYTFSNIPQGKYTVIFLYDTANYSATTYRKENVDETMNSDGIDTQITLDGVTRVAAITEEVIITDSNIYNIDLGLVSNPKFDLKLEKTVSKITVQDENGTKVYEYEDSKLAKKDLVGKQVNNTSIIVEYKIKVTNEGAISGFVKKIADYMPTEMKFSSELNKDWYTSENGVLYNSSLANTIINPGESKEVTLTLTKKMTEDNLGQYHNEAEIYEAYNDLGIEDTDSIEGNKQANEDDISSADVLITVKTGEIILFIGLTLTIILTIGISAYFIKKKVLR